MAMPEPTDSIAIPEAIRPWPIDHLGISTRAYFRLERAGIAILGDLDGRPWSFVFDLHGVGAGTARNIVAQVRAAVAGETAPPAAGLQPPPAGLEAPPIALMRWLWEVSTPRRHLQAALAIYSDGATGEALGADWNITRERAYVLARSGRIKARRLLALAPAWQVINAAAVALVGERGVVLDDALYWVLAVQFGWPVPPDRKDLEQLRDLLVLQGEVVASQVGATVVFARSTAEARTWARNLRPEPLT